MNEQKVGSFKVGGLLFEIFFNNDKTTASKGYYITDTAQQKLFVATNIRGDLMPSDKLMENIFRGIISLILILNDESDHRKDAFICPVAAFLYQFTQTDTFDGAGGSFQLGAVKWNVIVDDTYAYHRDVNGECDSNIVRIVLEGIDREDHTAKKPSFVRMIYLHEVFHGVLNTAGFTDHEEKFVKSNGLLLYEALDTLEVHWDKHYKVWPSIKL